MADQTVQFPTIPVELDGLFVTVGTATAPEPGPPEYGTGWVVKLVDRYGTILATPDKVNVDSITWELNQATQATFRLPKHTTVLIDPVVTEAQLFLNSDLMFWGPILTRTAGSGDAWVTYGCQSADWYFSQRRIGLQPDPPFIPNGSFEDGFTGWGRAQQQGASFSIVTSPTFIGDQAARVRWNGAGQTSPTLYRSYTQSAPFNSRWTAQAWIWIEPGSSFEDTTVLFTAQVQQGSTIVSSNGAELPANWQEGGWFVQEASVWAPSGQSTIFAIVHVPAQGGVVVDEVSLFLSGDYSPGVLLADTADVARILVMSAQDGNDVNVGVASGRSGIEWPAAAWPYMQHSRMSQMLEAATEYGEGFDSSIELTPTTRTWTPWPSGKGQFRSPRLELGSMLVNYSWSGDGTEYTNVAVVQGQGPDGGKVESQYGDQTLFDGLRLEDVLQAEEGTPTQTLYRVAEGVVYDSVRVGDSLSVGCHNGGHDFVFECDTGDTFRVSIVDGAVSVSGVWRVIRKTLHGDSLRADLVLVTA